MPKYAELPDDLREDENVFILSEEECSLIADGLSYLTVKNLSDKQRVIVEKLGITFIAFGKLDK